ncbi:MAG: phytoene/squalene synthase family protein [Fibrobacterota bacterium]
MKIEKKLNIFKKNIVEGRDINETVYCRLILHKVSRTYALTIRSLGQPFREPVLIGYLLCRIADTYEDSPLLTLDEKIAALDNYRAYFRSVTPSGEQKKDVCDALYSITHATFSLADNEEFLATFPGPVLTRYETLPEDVREIICQTVTEMVAGMKKTVIQQNHRGEVGTETEKELDQYCYYVAGTVGNMLTSLFAHYSPWISTQAYENIRPYNADFGRALQLTNIIKDAMGDLRRGVSFIPKDLARRYNVSLYHMHQKKNRQQGHEVMKNLIMKALKDLNRAMEYCILLPKAEPRIRIFCMMPVLFAIKTLEAAAQNDDLLNPDKKIKISRDEVKRTIRFLFLNCLWDYQIITEYLDVLSSIEAILGIQIPHNFVFEKNIPVVHLKSDE